MIAVDTNVLAHLLLQGAYSEQASCLRERDADWAAPHLWRSEFRSVLLKYVRGGTLTLAQARARLTQAEVLMLGREFDADSARTLELADRSGCSAYDCEFIAVAEQLRVPLVTLDATILRAFPQHALHLSVAVQPQQG